MFRNIRIIVAFVIAGPGFFILLLTILALLLMFSKYMR